MPPVQRFRKCSTPDCDAQLPVGPRGGGPKRCVECGILESARNARDIQLKSGPGFERWRQGMIAAGRLAG